jgi:hypothetical protein
MSRYMRQLTVKQKRGIGPHRTSASCRNRRSSRNVGFEASVQDRWTRRRRSAFCEGAYNRQSQQGSRDEYQWKQMAMTKEALLVMVARRILIGALTIFGKAPGGLPVADGQSSKRRGCCPRRQERQRRRENDLQEQCEGRQKGHEAPVGLRQQSVRRWHRPGWHPAHA